MHQDPNDFDKLKLYKDFLLNPLSHDNLKTNYYKTEIYNAYLLLKKMRTLEKYILVNSNEYIYCNHSTNVGSFISYEIIVNDNLICYKILDGSYKIANINCTFIKMIENGTSTVLNSNTKLFSIQNNIYKNSMKTGFINEPLNDIKDVIYDRNGITLNELIKNL